MIIIKAFLSKTCLTRLIWPNREIHEDTVETMCSFNVKLESGITLRSPAELTGFFCVFLQKREAKVIYRGSHLFAAKHDKFCFIWVK